MTIQFQLKLHDFIDMQKDVIKNSRTHDVKGKYFRWGISIILLIALLLLLKISIVTVIISIVVAGIFWLIAPIIYPKIAFARLKGKIQQNDYSRLLKPCKMHFTDDGIDRVLDGETMHFPWKEFRKIQEDDSHYFLYVSDLQGIIIPKEPTVINGDVKQFQERIETYMNDSFALEAVEK